MPLDKVQVEIALKDNEAIIECECRVTHKTGVEMEVRYYWSSKIAAGATVPACMSGPFPCFESFQYAYSPFHRLWWAQL